MTVAEGSLEHGEREAVDLDEDDARLVGANLLARAPRHPLDHSQRVHVVVVDPEGDLEDERGSRRGESPGESPAERVHRDGVADQVRGDPEDCRIEDQNEQEPAQDRERQADPSDRRNGESIEDADDCHDPECAQHSVDPEAGQEHRRRQETRGGEGPSEHHAAKP